VTPRRPQPGALASTRPQPGPPRRATAAKQPRSTATTTARPTKSERSGVESWAVVGARVLLGLVLAWFGYHELVAPGQWTGYVPVVAASSSLAQLLVLAHGWMLLVLATALVAGVAPRLAAGVAAVLLLEVVASLMASGGLSDLVLRDVGVLGLAVALLGARHDRFLLQR
jgi:uncharacterized membrane protein YphA (DoxX/SURF4 family)